jgi:predicted permease
MQNLWQDVRYALRLMRKNPGFSSLAMLTLALGIGANTAIFSLVYGVLLRPLPYPQPDRIVNVEPVFPGGRNDAVDERRYLFWREHQSVFQAFASYRGSSGVNLRTGDRPERVLNRGITAEFFRVLGMHPEIGRDFMPGDDEPGAAAAAILSDGFWRRRFAADPNVLGRSIVLGTTTYTIIGVAPLGIGSELAADVYVPLVVKGNPLGGGSNFPVIARLKDGVTLAQANADMRVVAEQFRAVNPKMNRVETAGVFPHQEESVRDVRASLLILMSAVALVLLIACANVANLLLARISGRQREIAVRLAVGAGRWRLTRQLLTESLCLALGGSAAGIALAYAAVRAVVRFRPVDLPRLDEVALDWRVLLFTLGVAVFVGLLFGIAPALQSLRAGLQTTAGVRTTGGRANNRLRAVLVTAEFALSMILLVCAALLIRSFINLRLVDPGFDPEHVLTARMSLSGERYKTAGRVADFANDLASRLERTPGIERAAVTNYLPLSGGFNIPLEAIVGQPNPDRRFLANLEWFGITPHFFDVMGIRLRTGRLIDDRDSAAAPPTVVVNEAFAKRFFRNDSAVGRQILIAWDLLGPGFADKPRTIVGVVSNIHEGSLEAPPSPTVFVPFTQVGDAVSVVVNSIMPITVMARSQGDPSSISREVVGQIQAADSMLPVFDIRPMQQVVGDSIQSSRFMMMLLGSFAVLALVLASVGIYGVMSYAVAQRTREIGIRAALGASPENIVRMLLTQGLALAVTGAVIGAAGAAMLTRLLNNFLYGVTARDVVTFIATPLVLTLVALLACYVPARRALRVDPATALRYE